MENDLKQKEMNRSQLFLLDLIQFLDFKPFGEL